MFGFEHPALLLLLVVPIWMGYWIWTRQGHPVVMPFDHGSQSSGRAWSFLINFVELLGPVIVACVILIWASPKKHDIPQEKREVTNIQILLDCSGSMNSAFGGKLTPEGRFYNRFDASKAAIEEFLQYRKGDAFGFTAYSDTVIHWVPLTLDTKTIIDSIDFVRPVTYSNRKEPVIPGIGAGTQTGKALLSCISELEKRPEGDKMILLISDGTPGDLKGNRPAEVAEKLRDAGIIVHAVYINSFLPTGSFYDVVQGTGGQVFPAKDPATLKKVFKEIDALQKVKMKAQRPLSRDDFFLFALIGIIATGLRIIASFKLRYTPW